MLEVIGRKCIRTGTIGFWEAFKITVCKLNVLCGCGGIMMGN